MRIASITSNIKLKRLIIYFCLYKLTNILGLIVVNLDKHIPDFNIYAQLCLTDACILCGNITIIAGALHCMPKGRYAILQVWFYYMAMNNFIGAVYHITSIVDTLS